MAMRLFLVLVISLVLGFFSVIDGVSVAPDDADSTCFEDSYVPPFSNEKVLLDTQNYRARTLVGVSGQNETWLTVDYDGLAGAFTELVSIYKYICRTVVHFDGSDMDF